MSDGQGMGRRGWGARAARALAVAVLAMATRAEAQFCSNCILNSAAPQVAQFNVGTGTVRGAFTASTGTFTYLYATNLTISNLAGDGSALTALNASQLTSGTVPAARVSGAYTGITQVGTLAAGVWNGTIIAPAYGGTGANLSISGTAGGLPYFSGSGVQGVVTSPAGPRVLATAGSGAKPVWTSSPSLTGDNFSAIPLSALNTGNLPSGIKATNSSLVTIDAAKVIGDISGGADYLTTPLPIGDLAPGTLPTTNAASSITVSGVQAGWYGGPTTLAQIRVGTDGRVYQAAQYNIVVYSTGIAPGPLPPGVTIAAAQVTSGTLAGDVIASSVAASGVLAGTYGAANRALTAVVGVDGRLTSLTQANIALPLSQLNSGTLPAGVLLPAASVNAGSLGSSVIASSVAASGVAAGVYGAATVVPQLTIGPDGRVTSATQFSIPGVSTRTAFIDVNNNWHGPTQVSDAAWYFGSQTTIAGPLVVTAPTSVFSYGITAATFTGNGAALTHLTAANIDAGYLGSSVIASSVNARAVGDLQLTLTGVSAGSKGTSSRIPTVVVDAQGRITSLTDQTVAVSTGEVSGIVQVAKGGTGNDWSAVTTGALPYFSGTGAMSTVGAGTNGYTLVMSGGVPAWAASSSSATHLSGGGVGQIVYQSAANATAFLPAMGAGGIITGNGTSAIPSTGTFTGTANQVIITRTGSNIVLSAPQDLGTGSSPTFVTVTAALNGNATTATSATTATNLAGGAAGRIPMQTASGTTTLLPAMGAVGIIVGNGTSAVASTATLTGTANQVVVTQTGAAVTLSLPQSINSGATPTFTGTNFTGIPESGVTNLVSDLAAKASTGTSVAFSTIVILQNGVGSGAYTGAYYPTAPLIAVGSVNAPWQLVLQNLSNGTAAASDLVLTNDLGSNTSYYLDIFINSSKYSQTGFSAQTSSATGVASSDSDLHLWAGTNGGLNNAANERIIFGSSVPTSGNIAGYLLTATASGPGAWVFTSSVTITASGGLSIVPGGLADGVIYGQDIANSTITLNKLNTSGASTNYVVQYNGSNVVWGAAPTPSMAVNASTFNASGTFTVPATVNLVWVTLCGGGGGGGGGAGDDGGGNESTGGGGGGAGSCIYDVPVSVTAGSIITVTISTGGAGASGGASGNNAGGIGGNASASVFGSTPTLTAAGGGGGCGGRSFTAVPGGVCTGIQSNGGVGGGSAAGGTGTTNPGGTGAAGTTLMTLIPGGGGGGGGAANAAGGPGGQGTTGVSYFTMGTGGTSGASKGSGGGAGGGSFFGGGGAGGNGNTSADGSPGTAGTRPGSGGGGGASSGDGIHAGAAGAAGAPGYASIKWVTP